MRGVAADSNCPSFFSWSSALLLMDARIECITCDLRGQNSGNFLLASPIRPAAEAKVGGDDLHTPVIEVHGISREFGVTLAPIKWKARDVGGDQRIHVNAAGIGLRVTADGQSVACACRNGFVRCEAPAIEQVLRLGIAEFFYCGMTKSVPCCGDLATGIDGNKDNARKDPHNP